MFRLLVRLVVPGSCGPQGNPRDDPRSLDDETPAGAGPRLVAPTAAVVDVSLESLAGTRATAEYPGSSEGPRREAVATISNLFKMRCIIVTQLSCKFLPVTCAFSQNIFKNISAIILHFYLFKDAICILQLK